MENATLVTNRPVMENVGPWSDEKQRRDWLRETDELLFLVEECRLRDLPTLPEDVYDRVYSIQERLQVSYPRPPRSSGESHDHLFDLQLRLMGANPRNSKRKINGEEGVEREGRSLPRTKCQARGSKGGFSPLSLPEDWDSIEQPEMATIVEAIVIRARDRWVLYHYELIQSAYNGEDAEQAKMIADAAHQNYLELKSQAERQLSRMMSLLVAPSPDMAVPVRRVLARTQRSRSKASSRRAA